MTTALSPWPDACQGAVSLTFDDGMGSQLAVAIPLLDKYGLQGSFYVNPRENYREQLLPWQAAAQAGHEMGNHTVNHPCSQNFSFITDNQRRSLEEMTLDGIEAEIVNAGQRLRGTAQRLELVGRHLLRNDAAIGATVNADGGTRLGHFHRTAQEQRVQETEDGGVGSDTQRERNNGDDSKAWLLEQHPRAVAQILKKGLHQTPLQ